MFTSFRLRLGENSFKSRHDITLGKAFLMALVLFGLMSLYPHAGLAQNKMYWTDQNNPQKIQRANLDGTGVEDLVTGLGIPIGIALDVAAGKMYWSDSGPDKIQRANLDGTGVEDLITTGISDAQGIALDIAAGKMYWADAITQKIQRANLDGTGVEDLITAGLSLPSGIALDLAAGKMYWTDFGTFKIQRANLDGSSIEDLVTGLSIPEGIALDIAAGKMYWADFGTAKIQRANLDGTVVEDLVTGLSNPSALALNLAAGKLYWSDRGASKIQRANLNGTSVEDIVIGPSTVVGLALDVLSSAGKDLVFLAERNLSLAQATTDGNIHSNKDITFKAGKGNTYTGDITAVGKLTIQKQNTIDGDVTAGTVANSGTVTGIITNATVPAESLPVLNFTAGGDNINVPKNGAVPLAPGSYGNVSVLKAGTLRLSSGEYFMNMLTLVDQTVLEVDVGGGEVVVNVVGLLAFGKKSQVVITPGGENDTDQVTFNRYDGGEVKILSNAKVLGSIVSPGATVSLMANSRFKGSIIANVINVNKGVVALAHGSSTALPKLSPDFEDDDGAEEELEITALPTAYALDQNYPNPFNPETKISYRLKDAGDVRLTIFNLRGQEVRTLVSSSMIAGNHSVVWNGRNDAGQVVPSGIYLYRLQVSGFVETRKLTLVR
jgi:sugar lactone lactonase YvrE